MHTRLAGWSLRRILLGTMLLGTLLAAWLLAREAEHALQSHRETAEDVLGGYTAFAAQQFGSRADIDLSRNLFYPMYLYLLGKVPAEGPVPTPAKLDDIPERLSGIIPSVDGLFRLQVDPPRLVSSDPRILHGESSQLAELAASMVGAIESSPTQNYFQLLVPEPATGEQAFLTWNTSDGVKGGYWLAAGTLQPVFEAAFSGSELIPVSLTHGVEIDEYIVGSVTTQSGTELYSFGSENLYADATAPFVARDTLSTALGDLVVGIRINASAAERLLPGGVPRSRAGATFGLVALTAVLIAASLYLIRQETRLAQTRADFVSGISHEFRTPLAQIRMFSETLLLGRTRSDDESRRYLEIIDKEARRLTHLVETVLHFSRAERGALTIHPTSEPIDLLVEEVAEAFTPIASSHSVRLIKRIEPGVIADVDRNALKQTIVNLLDNAVKYGPDGQTVLLGLHRRNGSVQITVDDEGPGIPEADRKRIWERFRRLDRDTRSTTTGSGIGLSVVREIVEMHGGKVWVENRTPSGSHFVIDLPNSPDSQS